VENLSFRYSDAKRLAVKDFSMRIQEGEIVILAGPSGCGKSTLLRAINGLIPHMYSGVYTGEVYVKDIRVAGEQMSKLAQNVGILFQNPENQIFMFSVERDIAFGLENLGVPMEEIRERVDESMRLLEITDLAHRAPHELSDGQKQRVALAGVIAMRPRLIILDEPTSLLDPKTATELVELVRSLRDETGITFVVVEHRIDLLVRIADRIIVMNEGTKVLDGKPAEILSNESTEAYGISVPAVTRLQNQLKRDGLPLRQTFNPEELAEELNGRTR